MHAVCVLSLICRAQVASGACRTRPTGYNGYPFGFARARISTWMCVSRINSPQTTSPLTHSRVQWVHVLPPWLEDYLSLVRSRWRLGETRPLNDPGDQEHSPAHPDSGGAHTHDRSVPASRCRGTKPKLSEHLGALRVPRPRCSPTKPLPVTPCPSNRVPSSCGARQPRALQRVVRSRPRC